jgi:hypothetical protein
MTNLNMVALRANVAAMRDTWRLRQRLVMLACLPVLGTACDDPPASAAEPAKSDAKQVAKAAKAAKNAKDAPPKRSGPRINDAVEPTSPPDPDAARTGPVAGDPPWIDGYNPEEEPCPSGNWCGTIATAMAIAPSPDSVPKEMECPVRIGGPQKDTKIEGPKYAGLSAKPSMQGALNQHGTELARAGGKKDACCYHWFEYCSGRPLLDNGHAAPGLGGGAPVLADAIDGAAWIGERIAVAIEPAEEIRGALVEAWLADAAAEHASVASFARVVLELLAVGAPSELVAAAIDAGQDEVAHAKSCYAIASRLGGRDKGPGRLPIVGAREATLVRVAVDTFVEGCVGETIAALAAERAAARAEDPAIREILEQIAEDESRHAALAWRTVRWAVCEGGLDVIAALRDAAASVLVAALPSPPTPEHRDWNRFGRLTAREHEQTVGDARREIIAPMLASLLA